MKILHLSLNDIHGGAAKAAFRLHQAYLNQKINSRMQVVKKCSDFHTINGPSHKIEKVVKLVQHQLALQLMRLQTSPNPIIRSPAVFPSKLPNKLNSIETDVIHLHWICGEFLSVEDIGKLKKPLVWTLHDMWPFSGSEHYGDDGEDARWRVGYYPNNRPEGHKGLDIDRWVWNRKRRAWKKPIHIVTPTQWMANSAQKSILMQNWPISVIPNPLNTERFRPWDKGMARQLLGLPQDKQLVVFGAISGSKNPRKGWDLLESSLTKLATRLSNLAGVIFGQSEPLSPPQLAIPLYWMGHLNDEVTLALLYSAADVTVVPSRQDNLPQSGTEAQSCGCPVVAFNTSGLPSVVVHQTTGYLATPFNCDDLANGITWVLENQDRYVKLSEQARDRAVKLWSPKVVVKQYMEVYESAITLHQH